MGKHGHARIIIVALLCLCHCHAPSSIDESAQPTRGGMNGASTPVSDSDKVDQTKTEMVAQKPSDMSGTKTHVARDFRLCADYPTFKREFVYGQVVPPIGWANAYRGDGSQTDFSFENFYCSDDYADRTVLILMIGAGWCQACSRLIQAYIDPQADELTNTLGAELIYVEIQDAQWEAADNRFAYEHLRKLINDGVGWRVGDLETLIRDGESMKTAPKFLTRQPNLMVPGVWVIRKRDMRLIATRDLALMSRPGELPLALIAADPEKDWRRPPPPPFKNECSAGDDEETSGALNNQPDQATPLTPGTYTGGICDENPDFYSILTAGTWRLTVDIDRDLADLDVMVWDPENNTAAMDESGMFIGSFGSSQVETLTGEGPTLVKVFGLDGSSSAYTIRLDELN